MARHVRLNGLRMFEAAARHLNFRKAAEELHLTQGAVAQQVRKLESDLGVTLFHREARGLSMTDEGRKYFAAVARGLDIIDGATQSLMVPTDKVTISVPPSFAAKWLVPRLNRFSSTHPDMNLQTIASEDLATFHGDGIDIAVRIGHPPFGDDLESKLISAIDLCAVAAPTYASRFRDIERIEDFAGHNLIQDSHEHWRKLLENAPADPTKAILQFNQTALAMDAAINGQGVALVPFIFADDEIAANRLVVLWRDDRADQAGFHLVWRQGTHPGSTLDTVIRWIDSELAKSGISADEQKKRPGKRPAK